MFNINVFDNSSVVIPENTEVIFVSDLFSDDILGGAELTTDALIEYSPMNVFRLHSKKVTMKILSDNQDKFWIFGNFFSIDMSLLPSIIANLKYAIVEYDYKYCKYRSPEKHAVAENNMCACHESQYGKMISAFYYGANSLWWMSQKQMEIYHHLFPFLSDRKNTVLSSIFRKDFFEIVETLNEKNKDKERAIWTIVGSTSWIKGVPDSEEFCNKNNLSYETAWNLPHEEMLEKLSLSKGIVFLPKGGDTCPRFVIEAKILGCDLILNTNVQHASEAWFKTKDVNSILDYLKSRPTIFWKEIEKEVNYTATLSGYTTTYNCISQDYPFEESISSMLDFCDQVVVVDAGSDDGTWERLEEMVHDNSKLIIHMQKRDMKSKRFAVFDGLQKALARVLCTGDFCWQQDSDEIVHEDDYRKVRELIRVMPKNIDLIALPVIEYWGGHDKVRIDVNPWKWRFSRNKPHITHGIPASLRLFDEDGSLYANVGTDGCDYIRSDTFEPVQFASFYDDVGHKLRMSALDNSNDAIEKYKEWITQALENLPSVHHYSWYNIERKITTYKNYWSKHWQSLYNIEQKDIPENNMFFNQSWKDITEDEIKKMADRLSKEMGGWIFHKKVDFSIKTPSISLDISPPKIATKRFK